MECEDLLTNEQHLRSSDIDFANTTAVTCYKHDVSCKTKFINMSCKTNFVLRYTLHISSIQTILRLVL